MSKGMNYNRPQFRLQGRQTINAREEWERERQCDKAVGRAIREWSPPKKAKPKHRPKPNPPRFDLAASVADDVRDIANHEYFNTPEKVAAEVERRLAWHRERGLA